MGASAADKCDLPPSWTAEGFRFRAVTMFLKEPETNTSLGPVCGKVSGKSCVKNSDTMLYLTNDVRDWVYAELWDWRVTVSY